MEMLLASARTLESMQFRGETLNKDDIVKIAGNSGGAQALEALINDAGKLADLEFGGSSRENLKKDDIVKILGSIGASQAVAALLNRTGTLIHIAKADVLEAAGKSGASTTIRKLK